MLRNNEKPFMDLLSCTRLLFVLWLITEVVFEHTFSSRIILVLFMVSTALLCQKKKGFRFSIWMLIYGVFLLFAVVASLLAVHTGPSWRKVFTVALNGVFLSFFYQYIILESDLERPVSSFLIGTFICAVLICILCYPLDFDIRRFGQIRDSENPSIMINIVNPNLIGTISAFSLAFSFSRLLREKKWIWIIPVFLFGVIILLTKSLKAYSAALFLAVTVILIRFPKYWPIKLAGLMAVILVIYFKVIPLFPRINQTFFYNMRATLSYILYRDTTEMSINARTELASLGMNVIRTHPLTGIGLDGFRFLEGADETYSHNNYIELLVSGGIPLAVSFYALYLFAIAAALKKKKETGPFIHTMLAVTAVQVFLDMGMVSYVDRTALIWPIWLLASIKKETDPDDDGGKGFEILSNPFVLVRYASNRSMLKWMPDKVYLKMLYRGIMGRKLHLNPPETMTEKQQWMKLYDRNPLYPRLVDKIEVRSFVTEKIGDSYLIPILGIWDSVSDIQTELLPDRFVLKCSHDSGSAIACSDREKFDFHSAKEKLEKHMKTNYYWSGREWPYKDLKHHILAEAYIGDESGRLPTDYKVFCFHGIPKMILVCANRTEKHADYYFYDMEWKPLPINEDTARDYKKLHVERPASFDEMMRIARALSENLPFVRVDLYEMNGKVYFGEMTLFDQSGFASDYIGNSDSIVGSFLQLGGKHR